MLSLAQLHRDFTGEKLVALGSTQAGSQNLDAVVLTCDGAGEVVYDAVNRGLCELRDPEFFEFRSVGELS